MFDPTPRLRKQCVRELDAMEVCGAFEGVDGGRDRLVEHHVDPFYLLSNESIAFAARIDGELQKYPAVTDAERQTIHEHLHSAFMALDDLSDNNRLAWLRDELVEQDVNSREGDLRDVADAT